MKEFTEHRLIKWTLHKSRMRKLDQHPEKRRELAQFKREKRMARNLVRNLLP